MKKKIALILAMMMVFAGLAFAEDAATTEPQQPPEMADGQRPPELPSGEMPKGPPDGQPPEMPEGGMGQPPEGGPGGAPGGFGGGAGEVNTGTGKTTITETTAADGETYTSTDADENALRVEGEGVVADITGATIEKTGDASNSEASAFYGLSAASLALDGATLNLSGATITTDANGGNGAFAYGTGTVNIADSTITTAQGNSGGVMLAGGGTVNAKNLTVDTSGQSSAAIRTDRGGGTMTVSGGIYATHGLGSPAVYSTAVVSVSDAALTAENSEAIVVEGKNSVALSNCDIAGNMTSSVGGENDNLHTVMIYQSMSGDADVGQSHFSMAGGTLTGLNGDMIYVTNTSCTIDLSGAVVTNQDPEGRLLVVSGNSSSRGWGKAGANGGTCELTVSDMTLSGEIVVDEISSLSMTMQAGCAFQGMINLDGDAGTVNVVMEEGATWSLKGDSHVTSFDGDLGQVETNGFALYVGGVQAA